MAASISHKTITRLLNVTGLGDKVNDLILSRVCSGKSENLVIFFHGDIQDYSEMMSANPNSKNYCQWNLEDTGSILAKKFSNHVIMTVKASRIDSRAKACFDNFVKTDRYGEPTFAMDIKPLMHLQLLTEQAIKSSDWLSSLKCIKLIGFSQGMTVINQIIHSLYSLDQSPNSDLEAFASLIKHIYWLDGGKCWLTDEKIIQTLKNRRIFGHVYVTPLQVCNRDRPDNQINYKIFLSFLDCLKIDHVHKLYYKDSEPSFAHHFQLLADFDSD
ncbi:UPF0565 protein C2orf69 homolog isoform X2 [Tetranychus urticae]|uniref:Uncharacterized protein n=1 Tax=Tetranychus urticae TaxID=32264 RepID=T1K3H0_TETUR|nr:UPF0565 protein C2orf69 homolog isoform X2 [Tetranychus urticae]